MARGEVRVPLLVELLAAQKETVVDLVEPELNISTLQDQHHQHLVVLVVVLLVIVVMVAMPSTLVMPLRLLVWMDQVVVEEVVETASLGGDLVVEVVAELVF